MLQKEDIYAYKIEGKRYDLGTKMDYLKTIVEFSINQKDISKEFIAYLKEIIKNLE